jgi:hypothetical protein
MIHPVPPPMAGNPRKPEEIRRMLSIYRSGLERGRQASASGPRPRAGNGWDPDPDPDPDAR